MSKRFHRNLSVQISANSFTNCFYSAADKISPYLLASLQFGSRSLKLKLLFFNKKKSHICQHHTDYVNGIQINCPFRNVQNCSTVQGCVDVHFSRQRKQWKLTITIKKIVIFLSLPECDSPAIDSKLYLQVVFGVFLQNTNNFKMWKSRSINWDFKRILVSQSNHAYVSFSWNSTILI